MRIRNLIIGDVKFQIKYGFYFVYAVFTLFYICLLYVFPPALKENVGTILIYTDPAAMGLFFMGAIVLLEKSQRVLNSIAVSPVKVSEYIISKVVSLGLIGTVVGILIAIVSGIKNIPVVILGTFLGSVIFTLIGLMISSKVNSINQFLVATIPFELLCFIPPIMYQFGYRNPIMLLHPGCIVIRLIGGEGENILIRMALISIWILILYLITYKIMNKMFQSVGGVKL